MIVCCISPRIRLLLRKLESLPDQKNTTQVWRRGDAAHYGTSAAMGFSLGAVWLTQVSISRPVAQLLNRLQMFLFISDIFSFISGWKWGRFLCNWLQLWFRSNQQISHILQCNAVRRIGLIRVCNLTGLSYDVILVYGGYICKFPYLRPSLHWKEAVQKDYSGTIWFFFKSNISLVTTSTVVLSSIAYK